MRRRGEWRDHVHRIRRRELELIFGGCPPGAFERALELGAGDGFQAHLLLGVAREVVATDFHDDPGTFEGEERLHRLRADAERIDEILPPATFDLVFSSSVLEHLPDPGRALVGTTRLLKRGGLAIHIVPGPLWKLAHLLLFYPDRLARLVERLLAPDEPAPRAHPESAPADNNPKVARTHGWLRRQLWPVPHGAYRWNLEELVRFRRGRWVRLAERAGLEVACVLKGPVASGYGFGFDRARTGLERLGVATEYALVAHHRGERPALLDRVCSERGADPARAIDRERATRPGGQVSPDDVAPSSRRNTNSLHP